MRPGPHRRDVSRSLSPFVSKRPGNRALVFLLAGFVLAASCRRPEVVTLRAGLLLDGRGGQLRDAVITVTGDRITSIEPYHGGVPTHDLSAYTVLPGLIDAH